MIWELQTELEFLRNIYLYTNMTIIFWHIANVFLFCKASCLGQILLKTNNGQNRSKCSWFFSTQRQQECRPGRRLRAWWVWRCQPSATWLKKKLSTLLGSLSHYFQSTRAKEMTKKHAGKGLDNSTLSTKGHPHSTTCNMDQAVLQKICSLCCFIP